MNRNYIIKCLLWEITEVYKNYGKNGNEIKQDQLTYLLNAFPYFVRTGTWLKDGALVTARVNTELKPSDPVGTTIAVFLFKSGTFLLAKSRKI